MMENPVQNANAGTTNTGAQQNAQPANPASQVINAAPSGRSILQSLLSRLTPASVGGGNSPAAATNSQAGVTQQHANSVNSANSQHVNTTTGNNANSADVNAVLSDFFSQQTAQKTEEKQYFAEMRDMQKVLATFDSIPLTNVITDEAIDALRNGDNGKFREQLGQALKLSMVASIGTMGRHADVEMRNALSGYDSRVASQINASTVDQMIAADSKYSAFSANNLAKQLLAQVNQRAPELSAAEKKSAVDQLYTAYVSQLTGASSAPNAQNTAQDANSKQLNDFFADLQSA